MTATYPGCNQVTCGVQQGAEGVLRAVLQRSGPPQPLDVAERDEQRELLLCAPRAHPGRRGQPLVQRPLARGEIRDRPGSRLVNGPAFGSRSVPNRCQSSYEPTSTRIDQAGAPAARNRQRSPGRRHPRRPTYTTSSAFTSHSNAATRRAADQLPPERLAAVSNAPPGRNLRTTAPLSSSSRKQERLRSRETIHGSVGPGRGP